MTPASPLTTDREPTEALLAEQPIVYFDGVCGICNWSVDFLLRRDSRRQFRFAPLQGETATTRLNIPASELLKSIVFEDQTGQYQRSDAVWRILVRLGGGWAILGRLLWCIPRPVRNGGYNLISRNRYSLFGKKDSCRIPSREERARFLP